MQQLKESLPGHGWVRDPSFESVRLDDIERGVQKRLEHQRLQIYEKHHVRMLCCHAVLVFFLGVTCLASLILVLVVQARDR